MKTFMVTSLVGAMMLTGCVQVPKRIDVNLNTGADRKASDSETPAPSQVPAAGASGSWRDVATDVAGRVSRFAGRKQETLG